MPYDCLVGTEYNSLPTFKWPAKAFTKAFSRWNILYDDNLTVAGII